MAVEKDSKGGALLGNFELGSCEYFFKHYFTFLPFSFYIIFLRFSDFPPLQDSRT